MNDEDRVNKAIIDAADNAQEGWRPGQAILPGFQWPGMHVDYQPDGSFMAPGGRYYYWGRDGKLHYSKAFEQPPDYRMT